MTIIFQLGLAAWGPRWRGQHLLAGFDELNLKVLT